MKYRYVAYIRPVGQSTALIEMIQSDYLNECKTMATMAVERLAINGALPNDSGFFHIRDCSMPLSRPIVYESPIIKLPNED